MPLSSEFFRLCGKGSRDEIRRRIKAEAKNGRLDVVQLLVEEFGADVTVRDGRGAKPVVYAIEKYPDIAKYLEEAMKKGVRKPQHDVDTTFRTRTVEYV